MTLIIAIMSLAITDAHSAAFQQSTQLKAGGYFPATKAFEPGTGIDLAYSIKPLPYAAVDAAIGYYRAENGAAGFISTIPLTISARAILPLQYINFYTGGGVGTYFKMAGGTTEIPSDHSEFSTGYHANAGIEFTASPTLSLLLEGKYVSVNQGTFRAYNIKHGGIFTYGGFSLNF